MKLRITLTVLLSVFSTITVQAENLPGKGVSVYPVQGTIIEESFQTLLVSRALSALGYQVLPARKVAYDTAYSLIASNEASFMAVNWSPLHHDKYLSAGGDARLYRRGHLIVGAAQGYLVDKKTADDHGITHLSQLAEPEIAALFDNDNDGIADLVGCVPGWGCNEVIEHQLKSFGLQSTVTHHQHEYNGQMVETITRYQQGEAILYYTWTPHWVSGVLRPGRDVSWLKVPFSSLPGDRAGVDTSLPNGDDYGFEMNSQRIVAGRSFTTNHPVAAKLFEVMKLPVQDVNTQNLKIHQGESSADDIERHVTEWIESHQSIFNGWLSIALSAQRQ